MCAVSIWTIERMREREGGRDIIIGNEWNEKSRKKSSKRLIESQEWLQKNSIKPVYRFFFFISRTHKIFYSFLCASGYFSIPCVCVCVCRNKNKKFISFIIWFFFFFRKEYFRFSHSISSNNNKKCGIDSLIRDPKKKLHAMKQKQ